MRVISFSLSTRVVEGPGRMDQVLFLFSAGEGAPAPHPEALPMKRDMALARAILLAMEAHENLKGRIWLRIEGFTEEQITYHVQLLAQGGLIQAFDASTAKELRWIP